MSCRDSRQAAFRGHSQAGYRSSAMQDLTPNARQRIDDIAARNGVSADADGATFLAEADVISRRFSRITNNAAATIATTAIKAAIL